MITYQLAMRSCSLAHAQATGRSAIHVKIAVEVYGDHIDTHDPPPQASIYGCLHITDMLVSFIIQRNNSSRINKLVELVTEVWRIKVVRAESCFNIIKAVCVCVCVCVCVYVRACVHSVNSITIYVEIKLEHTIVQWRSRCYSSYH